MLSIRKFHHVVTLAEEGNFTRAAARLGMSQPALSRSIAALEQSCGLRLFDRRRSGVSLTAPGADFLRDAKQILGRIGALEQSLTLQSRGITGAVSMGMGPLAASLLMTRLLSRALHQWPSLQIVASIGSTEELVDQVMNGKLDFCIFGAGGRNPFPALSARKIGTFKLGYFVRSGHPLARATTPLVWDDLAPFPRAAGELQTTGKVPLPAIFGHLDTTVQCNEYDILHHVMLETDTIWLTSARLLEAELMEGRVYQIQPDPDAPAFSADIFMGRLAERSVPRILKKVIDTVFDLIGNSNQNQSQAH